MYSLGRIDRYSEIQNKTGEAVNVVNDQPQEMREDRGQGPIRYRYDMKDRHTGE